ncbi:hypothetical protein HDV05_003099 [Chytridiales sp. JEL 0842]|nr:hypothetical protein HDV05_003099 [Chytridiales sp. JEL 0842]
MTTSYLPPVEHLHRTSLPGSTVRFRPILEPATNVSPHTPSWDNNYPTPTSDSDSTLLIQDTPKLPPKLEKFRKDSGFSPSEEEDKVWEGGVPDGLCPICFGECQFLAEPSMTDTDDDDDDDDDDVEDDDGEDGEGSEDGEGRAESQVEDDIDDGADDEVNAVDVSQVSTQGLDDTENTSRGSTKRKERDALVSAGLIPLAGCGRKFLLPTLHPGVAEKVFILPDVQTLGLPLFMLDIYRTYVNL